MGDLLFIALRTLQKYKIYKLCYKQIYTKAVQVNNIHIMLQVMF